LCGSFAKETYKIKGPIMTGVYGLHYAEYGGLRLVGSIKLKVTFAKEPYKRDDILQKRPISPYIMARRECMAYCKYEDLNLYTIIGPATCVINFFLDAYTQ